MKVASLLSLFFWLLCADGANAACPSFNIIYPPMRTLLCPGDVITYTCAFSSSLPIVIPLWTGSGFQCSIPGAAANTIQLTQSAGVSLNTVPVSCGNLSAVMTNISGTCYTSVLTIPTPQYFNGTTVICKDGYTNTLIGSDTLNIQLTSRPNAPTIASVTSTYSEQRTVTVTWISVPTATSYNVSINDSVNTLVPIPSTGAPQYKWNFTGLTNNTVYTVSVVAINCAGSTSQTASTNQMSGAQSFSCDPNIAQPLNPGTITKCTCASGGATIRWNFTTLNLCPDKFNIISLTQLAPCSSSSSSGTCGAFLSAATNSPSQAGSACPSSTLTITANQSLNGLTIECRDVSLGSPGTLIGTRNINIAVPSMSLVTHGISTAGLLVITIIILDMFI